MSENNLPQAQAEVSETAPQEMVTPEEMFPKDVASFLKGVMAFLGTQAWLYMGLLLNPFTGKITKDLKQAKLAIDAVEILLPLMGAFLEEKEKQDFKRLLIDLQMNFVDQNKPGEQ